MDDLDLLRHEFNAEDGSFLVQLRVDYHWDRIAFSRLEQTMRRVCAPEESREQLDRWLAEGYYDRLKSQRQLRHPSKPPPNLRSTC